MMLRRYLLAAAMLSLVLNGCTANKSGLSSPASEQSYTDFEKKLPKKELVEGITSAEALFMDAEGKLQKKQFIQAIKEFEAYDNRYPADARTPQVLFHLIYAYYQSASKANLELAKASIERLIRRYANTPYIDYAFYMRGVAGMALITSNSHLIQNIIDESARDTQQAVEAFGDLKRLLVLYPNSQYAQDAYRRLVFLKNFLAKHELAIAQFYTEREAYVAVIKRVEKMLADYPDTAATREALPLMRNAYRQLQLHVEADKIAALIAANPA